jgi:hypothetical protein
MMYGNESREKYATFVKEFFIEFKTTGQRLKSVLGFKFGSDNFGTVGLGT